MSSIEMVAAAPAVSLADRQRARRQAAEAYSRAYLAQRLPQQDGTVLHLCWVQRIGRAYDVLAETTDEKRQQLLRQGIDRLAQEAEADFRNAEQARSEYFRLCRESGIDPVLNLPDCQCDGCQATAATLEANLDRRLGHG